MALSKIREFAFTLAFSLVFLQPLKANESTHAWNIKYDEIDAKIHVRKAPPDAKWQTVNDFIKSVHGEFLDGIVSEGSGGFEVVRIRQIHLGSLADLVTDSAELVRKDIPAKPKNIDSVVVEIRIEDPTYLEKLLSQSKTEAQLQSIQNQLFSPLGLLLLGLFFGGITVVWIFVRQKPPK